MSETKARDVEKALLKLRRESMLRQPPTDAYMEIYRLLPQLTYWELNEMRLILTQRQDRDDRRNGVYEETVKDPAWENCGRRTTAHETIAGGYSRRLVSPSSFMSQDVVLPG